MIPLYQRGASAFMEAVANRLPDRSGQEAPIAKNMAAETIAGQRRGE